MALFADRVAAGRELAAALAVWRDADAIVFGIPRGGVVVAAEVSRVLRLPLVAVVVRKLGAPAREEYAIGAVAEHVRIVDDVAVRAGGVTPSQLAAVEERERAELRRRTTLFAAAEPVLAGKTAIVVDDGLATGATATAACRSLRARAPAAVVLAVPVSPADWRPDTAVVDEYVCPHRVGRFRAVGQFYADFTQTSDEEVVELLARSASAGPTDRET